MRLITSKSLRVLTLLAAGMLTASCSAGESSVVVDPGSAPPAALAARQALAADLQLEVESITIVKVEAMDWPDSCLGVEIEGVACADVITPGYQVILEAEGQMYEVHTNQDGSRLQILAEIAG